MTTTITERERIEEVIESALVQLGFEDFSFWEPLSETNIDSLSLFEVSLFIEEEFGLDFTEIDLEKIKSLQDLVDLAIAKRG